MIVDYARESALPRSEGMKGRQGGVSDYSLQGLAPSGVPLFPLHPDGSGSLSKLLGFYYSSSLVFQAAAR